jgi:AcrR family transcriptional regulator
VSTAAKARVVTAAGEIADADGLEAVTLARVAAELGIRPPSLYNHVEGRAGLLRELRLESVGEIGAVMKDAAVGRSREEALRAVAVAYRTYALEHPGRYATTLGAPTADDPEATRAAEAAIKPIVAILAGWGIEGDEALHLVRVIRSALHGFVSIELGGGFGLPLDLDTSFALLTDSLVTAIQAAAPAPR